MPEPNDLAKETVLNRQAPPPDIVAAAEKDHQWIGGELDALLPIVRALLAGCFTEVEALTDVWLTLLWQEPKRAALLGATAIMRLAKNNQPTDRPESTMPGADDLLSAARLRLVGQEQRPPGCAADRPTLGEGG